MKARIRETQGTSDTRIRSPKRRIDVETGETAHPADPDDILTPREAQRVRDGEAQLRQGLYVTLEQLEDALEHKACKAGRKAV